MSKRPSNKNSSLPYFLSGLTGALVGGLLIFFLTGGGLGAMSNDSNKEAINPPQTQAEQTNVSKSQIDKSIGNLDDESDSSMESKVVKKSIDSVVGITTKSQVTKNTFWGPQSGSVVSV